MELHFHLTADLFRPRPTEIPVSHSKIKHTATASAITTTIATTGK